MADTLERIVEVNQNFVQRNDAGQDDARTIQALCFFNKTAPIHHDAHHIADAIAGANNRGLDHRLLDVIDARHIRQMDRIVDLHLFAAIERHAIDDRRMRADDVQIEFAAQPFLHHFHVQQA